MGNGLDDFLKKYGSGSQTNTTEEEQYPRTRKTEVRPQGENLGDFLAQYGSGNTEWVHGKQTQVVDLDAQKAWRQQRRIAEARWNAADRKYVDAANALLTEQAQSDAYKAWRRELPKRQAAQRKADDLASQLMYDQHEADYENYKRRLFEQSRTGWSEAPEEEETASPVDAYLQNVRGMSVNGSAQEDKQPSDTWDNLTRAEKIASRAEAEAVGMRTRESGGSKMANVAVPDNGARPLSSLKEDPEYYMNSGNDDTIRDEETGRLRLKTPQEMARDKAKAEAFNTAYKKAEGTEDRLQEARWAQHLALDALANKHEEETGDGRQDYIDMLEQDLSILRNNDGKPVTLLDGTVVQPQDAKAWSDAIEANISREKNTQMARAAITPIMQAQQSAAPGGYYAVYETAKADLDAAEQRYAEAREAYEASKGKNLADLQGYQQYVPSGTPEEYSRQLYSGVHWYVDGTGEVILPDGRHLSGDEDYIQGQIDAEVQKYRNVLQAKQEMDEAFQAYQTAQIGYNYAYQTRYSDIQQDENFQENAYNGRISYQFWKDEIDDQRRQTFQMESAFSTKDLDEGTNGYRDQWTGKTPQDDWSEEEKNTFFALWTLGKNDKTKAWQYAEDVNREHATKAYGEAVQQEQAWGAEHPVASFFSGVSSMPTAGADYLDDLLQLADTGTIMPRRELTWYGRSTARSQGAAEMLNEAGTLGEDWGFLEGKGAGDLYLLGQSILQSTSVAKLGGGAVNALFFFSAAEQDLQEQLLRDPENVGKAVAHSAWCGTCEVLGETLSVENLIDMNKSLPMIVQVLRQAGVEATEEGVTDWLNMIGDEQIYQYQSEMNREIRALMDQGVEYDDAVRTAWKKWSKELASDMLGGAISGGASAGMYSFTPVAGRAIGTAAMHTVGRIMPYAGDAQGLIDRSSLAKGFFDVDRARNVAQASLDRRGKISYKQASDLSRATSSAMRQVDIPTARAAATERLMRDGTMSKDEAAKSAERLVSAAWEGKTLSEVEQEAQEAKRPELTDLEKQTYREMTQQLSGDSSNGNWLHAENLISYQGRQMEQEAQLSRIRDVETKDGQQVRVTGAEMQDGKLQLRYEQDGKTVAASQEDLQLNEAQRDTLQQLVEILGDDAAFAYNAMGAGVMYGEAADILDYATDFGIIRDLFGARATDIQKAEQAALASPLRKGMTDAQVVQAVQVGYRHAQEGGSTAARPNAAQQSAETVDPSTEEGRERLLGSLAAMGEHAEEAAEAYESGQDVNAFAADMTKAAQLYAASGADVASIAKDVGLQGLTEAQLQTAQKIGGEIRRENQALLREASDKMKAMREAAQAITAEQTEREQEIRELDKAISEAESFGKDAKAEFQRQLDALEQMEKEDPRAAESASYQKALERANDAMRTVQDVQKAVKDMSRKKRELEGKRSIQRKKGTVSFDGGRIDGREVSGVDRSKLNRKQKLVVAMVERLADVVNLDYVFFQGKQNMGGAYVKGGTIYINLNAGNAEQTIAAATLSHELTHFLQEYDMAEYEALRQFIVDKVLEKSPAEFDALVAQQARWEPGKSYDDLVDEVVANACQSMLLQDKVIRQLARENMSLAEKVADVLEELRGRILAAFEGIGFKKEFGPFRPMHAVMDSMDEIADRWSDAMHSSLENYNAEHTLRQAGVETEKAETARDGGVQMMTWDEAEQKYGIKSVNDYIGVQKSVISTLEKDGFFDGVKNVITMNDGNMVIEITKDGIRETLGPGDRFQSLPRELKQAKIATIDQLPEVIKQAELKEDNVPNAKKKNSGLKYAYLQGKGEYADVSRDISITIRRSPQKNKFWIHQVDLSQESESEPDLSTSGGNTQQAYDEAQARTPIVADNDANSKREPKRKTAGSGQFQMLGDVEETDKLVAVHNKSVSGLRRMLQRGGVPFPSIAIKKAGTPHEGFGDVSIVFPRSTIDPEESRWNRLYSNDAWTPTEPLTEYDVGDTYKYKKLIEKLVGSDVYDALNGGGALYADYIERNLRSTEGDVFNALKSEPVLKYAYLKSIGKEPSMPTTQKTLDGSHSFRNEQLLRIFDELGGETVLNMQVNDDAMRERVAEILNRMQEEGLAKGTSSNAQKLLARIREHPLYNADMINLYYIKHAYKIFEADGNTVLEVPDRSEMERMLKRERDTENDPGYKQWVEKTFDGLIKDSGIPNGKDMYTDSGNLRSFKNRHVPATLENIVAQMRKEKERGNGVVGTVLRGAATKSYDTVEEMRAESGKLLGTHVQDDVYDSMMEGFNHRLHELTSKAAKRAGSYDGARESLLQAVRDAKSKKQMGAMLRKESDYWFNYSDELVNELWALRNDVQNMPAPYFEAKPRRVVYPEEALAYILPDNADTDVMQELQNRGYNVLIYKAGDEQDRLAKLNSVEGARFQQWDDSVDDTAAEARGRELAAARLQSEDAILRQTVEDLKKLTDKQSGTIEKLQKQLHLTKTPETRLGDARKMARNLLREYGSTADTEQLAARIKTLGDSILQTKASELDEAALKEQARDIAREIAENAVEEITDASEQYQEIVRRIKGAKLSLDESFLGELGDYEAFRRGLFGTLTIAKRKTNSREGRDGYTTVDQFYTELQEDFGPGLFPDYGNEGEMLEHISRILDLSKPIEVNPFEKYMGEAVEDISNQILQESLDGVLRPEPPTAADKAKNRAMQLRDQILELQKENELSEREAGRLYHTVYDLSMALDKAQSRYKTLQSESKYRQAQMMQEGRARAAEAKFKERARSAEKMADMKAHYQDMAKRYREKRNESAGVTKYRKRVDRAAAELYEMLRTNSDKLHVPEVLKEPLGEFLQGLDFTSKRALAGGEETKADQKFGARLQQIRDILENQQRYLSGEESAQQDLGGYLDISEDSLQFLRDCTEMITQAMAESGSFTVNQMNAEQLRDLASFLTNLKSAIRKMNSFLANERFASVREAASADITGLEALGRAKDIAENRILNEFLWKNGTPYYIFKRFGAGGESIFQGFAKGWSQMAFDARRIIEFTEKAYTDKEVKQWKKETHDFTLEDGSKITMTTAQIMELSQLLGRQQAVQHLQAGGMRIGNIETKTGAKGDATHYHLTDGDLQQILGALSERQAEVARNLQHFMAEQGAEWGNEVSMRRFGYRFYTEGDGYYPITTDPLDRPMADTDAQKNSMFRLLNLSSSKSLNPKATNALVVGDIFDTFTDHMADMAKLHGMGLPILDAIKWFNFKERIDRDDGGYDTRTLQGALEQAFGSAAGSYFRTLMKDINGQTENGDRGTGLANMAIGAYKAQAVAANLRVALLQPTAYLRAATVLKPRYMLAAFGNFKASVFAVRAAEAAWKEAMQHSGEMIWKDIGGYDTDLSRSMRSEIQHSESIREKIVDKSMVLAEWGDKLTWGRLWAACKAQARGENPGLSGQALMDATEALFREVIYSSQVMDSTLTRSELMRGKTNTSKVLTAFMAEPTLSVNILMDTASQYNLDKRRYGRAEAWKRNGKRFGKAMMIWCVTQTAAALVESIADAIRDDDDEEYWEKVLQALFGEDNAKRLLGQELGKNAKGVLASAYEGNLLQDFLLLNKLPVVKEAASLLTGFKSRNMMTEGAENLLNVYKIWRETKQLADGILEKPTQVTYYGKMTPWGKIYKTLQAVSQLSGTPLYGASRDAVAIWNSVMNGWKDEWKVKTYDADALSQSKLNKFNEFVADTGVTKNDFQRMTKEIDTSGNGSVSQAEAGPYLQAEEEAGRISREQAAAIWNATTTGKATYEEWLAKLGEVPSSKAKAKQITGVNYNDIDDLYKTGNLSASDARKALTEYGIEQDTAEMKLAYWDYQKQNPGTSMTTEDRFETYWKRYRPIGMTPKVYDDFKAQWDAVQGTDKNHDGKADSGSKKADRLLIIDSLPLTDEQKDELFLMNWAAGGLQDAPWHR